MGAPSHHRSSISSLRRTGTENCLQISTSRSKHITTKIAQRNYSWIWQKLERLLCFRWIQGERGNTLRFHFHEYKWVLCFLFFSFQTCSPCAVRHLVHTEHSKKNAQRQALSHHFSPHTSELAKHSESNWPSLNACKVFLELILIVPSSATCL